MLSQLPESNNNSQILLCTCSCGCGARYFFSLSFCRKRRRTDFWLAGWTRISPKPVSASDLFIFSLQKVQNVFLRTKMHHFTTFTFGVRKLQTRFFFCQMWIEMRPSLNKALSFLHVKIMLSYICQYELFLIFFFPDLQVLVFFFALHGRSADSVPLLWTQLSATLFIHG